MALDKKRFRVEQVEFGEDRGLWRLYENRELPEAERAGRDPKDTHRWEIVDTFQTERDATAHTGTLR